MTSRSAASSRARFRPSGQFWLFLVKIKNGFGENSPKILPKTENYTVKYTGTAGKFSVLRGVQCIVRVISPSISSEQFASSCSLV